jgi:Flp pilus assembly pilin Flp
MRRALQFLKDESGQDLIEYTLLIAFVVLGSAVIFLSVGDSTKPIWTNAGAQLNAAEAVANSQH